MINIKQKILLSFFLIIVFAFLISKDTPHTTQSDNDLLTASTSQFANPADPQAEQTITFSELAGNIKSYFSTIPSAMRETGQDQEKVFNGYIVKLKTPALADKYIELNTPKTSSKKNTPTISIATLESALSAQESAILSEQRQVEQEIKSLNPQAVVLRSFSNISNGLHVSNLEEKDIVKLEKDGFLVFENYQMKILLDKSVPSINASKVWQEVKDTNGVPVTGKGVRVGVIDTGVDYTHKDLGNCTTAKFLSKTCTKVINGYDFADNDDDPMDEYGHGTHVAAIVSSSGTPKGVAPDAQIYAYKVCDKDGLCYSSDVIAAIERAVDPNGDKDFSDHLDVVNISLGGSGNPDDVISKAVGKASNIGVTFVISAGNSGPYKNTIKSPGVAREAITVAASDTYTRRVETFSSRGPVTWENKAIMKPDVSAPGVNICAARFSSTQFGSPCTSRPNDSTHMQISGTSMAAPHVAGVAALIKQAHPDWTPRIVKAAIKNTAEVYFRSPLIEGTGIIDAYKALNLTSRPTFVQLAQIPQTNYGTITIRGIIDSPDFKQYTLSYARIDSYGHISENFKEIKTSRQKPETNTVSDLLKLNLNTILDGNYVIKITVENTDGLKAIDYGHFYVNKIDMTYPQNSDILRGGSTVWPIVKKAPDLANIKIKYSYRTENSTEWIPLSGYKLDTSNFKIGDYRLKASIEQNGIVDEEIAAIYLDPKLKKGWPQKVRWDDGVGWGGRMIPTIEDLDNDKLKEVIILKQGNPDELIVYNTDGTIKFTLDFPQHASEFITYDIDNDGIKEIVVTTLQNGILSFKANGEPFEKWSQPILSTSIGKSRRYSLVAADLNNDNKTELILQSQWCTSCELIVLDTSGKTILEKEIPNTLSGPTHDETLPAVGNFDSDPELEIVIHTRSRQDTSTGETHIFNLDGSEISGFPISTNRGFFSGSGPIVGDIDNDGKEEVILSLINTSTDKNSGGLYVYDRQGKLKTGFPVLIGQSLTANSALLDIGSDNKLEIIVSSTENKTYIFNMNGKLRNGWPKQTKQPNNTNIVGSANNGVKNITTEVGTDVPFSNLFGEIYSWSVNGSPDANFPLLKEKGTGTTIITDINNDGKIDIVSSSNDDTNRSNGAKKNTSSLYVWNTNGIYQSEIMDWPMYRYDTGRTARYIKKVLDKTPRIALKPGIEPVAGYIDIATGIWKIKNYPGAFGTLLDICQYYYPKTKETKPYKQEEVSVLNITTQTHKCIEPVIRDTDIPKDDF